MLGHLSICVKDITKSAAFYDAALAPLGIVRIWTDADAIGYGPAGRQSEPLKIIETPGAAPPGEGFHLAFNAPDHAAVDAFHAAGIANGGTDNGPPGLRPHYSPPTMPPSSSTLTDGGWRRCIRCTTSARLRHPRSHSVPLVLGVDFPRCC